MAKDDFASDRAKKTLYVTGFDPKLTRKHVLEELFTQGGPVKEVTMFDTHAYILFHHEESVPYCLALFNEVELYGQKLRLNPRNRTKETYCYLKYLLAVRKKLMSEYIKITPPNLPPKQMPLKKAKYQDKSNKQTTRPKQKKKSRKNRTDNRQRYKKLK